MLEQVPLTPQCSLSLQQRKGIYVFASFQGSSSPLGGNLIPEFWPAQQSGSSATTPVLWGYGMHLAKGCIFMFLGTKKNIIPAYSTASILAPRRKKLTSLLQWQRNCPTDAAESNDQEKQKKFSVALTQVPCSDWPNSLCTYTKFSLPSFSRCFSSIHRECS